MQQSLKASRDLLNTLCWNDAKSGPRFTTVDRVGGALGPTFTKALVALVDTGRQLYDALRLRLDQSHGPAMMRAVQECSGEVIQVLRLDLNYYFPWTLMYDFKQPKVGATVCEGFRRMDGDQPFSCAKCLKECLHPDKRETYCAYGFWGTRHQIEQLVGGVAARDTVSTLQPIGEGAVHVAIGLEGGALGTLEAELRARLGHRPKEWISIAPPGEDLVERLRDAQGRPVLLLVASHCEAKQGALASTPRIQLPGAGHWLEPAALIDEAADYSPWRRPQPLVVLAACGTAAADLEGLSDFVASFLNAGASAVVGTEAVIFENLAVRFASTFTPEMLDGKTLGATILGFRQELLRHGDPLGFLFTAYGPADLAAAAPPVTAIV
jgi:hypothetical protein